MFIDRRDEIIKLGMRYLNGLNHFKNLKSVNLMNYACELIHA